MKNIQYSYILCFALGLMACGAQKEVADAQSSTETMANEVALNAVQVKAMEIKTARFEKKIMGNTVRATGIIDVPPQNRATVSAQIEGYVKNTDILPGNFVKQGQVLAILQHQSYIILQQDYLVLKDELVFLEQEYNRQKELSEENISAKKNFQRTEADYRIAKTKKASLEAQLSLIGINPSMVSPENLSSVIAVVSPINGYVKKVNISLGKLIMPNDVMFEITGDEHKHIELQVFDKDIAKIKVGQKVFFNISNQGSEEYEGEVFLIGHDIDMNTKTINIHIHIKEEGVEKILLPGMYINARILTDESVAEISIPEKALIVGGNSNYIFVQKEEKEGKTIYERIAVKVIKSEEGLVSIELLHEIPAGARYVQEGAYYLEAEMNKAGSEEE